MARPIGLVEWVRRIDLRPKLSRRTYLSRAGWIALALLVAISCAFYVGKYDGSLLWLVLTDIALVIACGWVIWPFMEVWGALIGTTDILGILLFALTPFVVPFFAPVALLWNLVQAVRAN